MRGSRWWDRRFVTPLVVDGPVNRVDCLLQVRQRLAGELARLGLLIALDEHAPIVDEFVP